MPGPDPAPIRGRWTLKPSTHPFVAASLEGPRVTESVEVVPVPDEAAIERGANKHSELHEWRRMLGDGPIARRQLAAVGDWDEFVALAVLRAALEAEA